MTGRARPRVCFLATASGDSADYIQRFHAAFPARRAVASHQQLFKRDPVDIRAHLLNQHVIYVGGGNTANMLWIWRLHGVDAVLREAWESGIVFCGVSAGMIDGWRSTPCASCSSRRRRPDSPGRRTESTPGRGGVARQAAARWVV